MTKEKFVTTISGERVPISKCRRYDSGYYKIGDSTIENSGDCYLIDNGNYHRFNVGQIVFNHSKNKYELYQKADFRKGFVNHKLDLGYFSKTINNVKVKLLNNEVVYAINSDIFIKNKQYRERLLDGMYYSITEFKAIEFNKKYKPSKEYKESLHYDAKNTINNAIIEYNNLYTSTNILNNESDISNIVKDLTFGLEFETTAGYIPPTIYKRLGLIPLRDGSISGVEYATIPLSGIKGVNTIVDSIKELKLRTEYDDSCSLHMHIGGMPRTKEFITAFFKVTLGVQDEIFKMFNLYKKYNFGYKNKNYCAPFNTFKILSELDSNIDGINIDRNFDVIFKYLSGGNRLLDYGSNDIGVVKSHPNDPNGNQKWNIKQRYHIHNFIPLIFGNKQTIEFRIHTPTYDIDKIMSFMFMNSILINFTIQNQTQILNGSYQNYNLDPIFKLYGGVNNINHNYINTLIRYFNQRTEAVGKNNLRSDIFFEESEIDCSFKFNVNKNSSTPIFNTTSNNAGLTFSDTYYQGTDISNNYIKESLEKLQELMDLS